MALCAYAARAAVHDAHALGERLFENLIALAAVFTRDRVAVLRPGLVARVDARARKHPYG